VREFIEREQPEYFFCGHIHEAVGASEPLGVTQAYNVGKKRLRRAASTLAKRVVDLKNQALRSQLRSNRSSFTATSGGRGTQQSAPVARAEPGRG
jgi:hypothetical protein